MKLTIYFIHYGVRNAESTPIALTFYYNERDVAICSKCLLGILSCNVFSLNYWYLHNFIIHIVSRNINAV